MKGMLTVAAIAALTVGALAQTPSPKPDATKSKTLLALQGAWVFTSANGEDAAGQPEIVITITDDKYVQTVAGDVVEKGTFKVDDTKKPIQIDIHVVEGQDAGATQLGVMELTTSATGTTMTGKLTNPGGPTTRPTDFTTAEGYFVFTASKRK